VKGGELDTQVMNLSSQDISVCFEFNSFLRSDEPKNVSYLKDTFVADVDSSVVVPRDSSVNEPLAI
jgi:hypothetical protein